MNWDRLGDILMIVCGMCYLTIVILFAYQSLFTLLLTVPLTLFSIAWLKEVDWSNFLQ